MREDVIKGIFDMYGFDGDRLTVGKINVIVNNETVRRLVKMTIRRRGPAPWRQMEITRIKRIMNQLEDDGDHTKDEAMDTAITCVYDSRRLEWRQLSISEIM